MEYAPVKNALRSVVRGNRLLTLLFFKALGTLFLRERYVKRELLKLLPRMDSGEILDAGFGYGQYSYWIACNFPQCRVFSVEIETVMLDDFACFLKKTGVNNIELGKQDLTVIEDDSRFDMALSVDVMEHIADDRAVFRNIWRSLKPGGIFLMHTPHVKVGAASGEGVFVGEHFRDGYSTVDLLEKMKQAGFQRIEHRLTYGRYGAMGWRLLQKHPITAVHKFKPFFLLLPVYLLLVYPLAEILMRLDMRKNLSEGDGILVRAYKDTI